MLKEHLKLFVNYMMAQTWEYNIYLWSWKLSFSFVDVKITHKNKQFVTSIFRKATFGGVFTNDNSFFLLPIR